jgi:hypothetical protein
VTVLFTDGPDEDASVTVGAEAGAEDESHGQWNLTEEGCEALADRLDDPDLPPPMRASDLLSFL